MLNQHSGIIEAHISHDIRRLVQFWDGSVGATVLSCLALDYRRVPQAWPAAVDLLQFVHEVLTCDMPEERIVQLQLPHLVLRMIATYASTLQQQTDYVHDEEDSDGLFQTMVALLLAMCKGRGMVATSCLNDDTLLALLISDADDVREEVRAFISDVVQLHLGNGIAYALQGNDLCHELAFMVLRGSAECQEIAARTLRQLLEARRALATGLSLSLFISASLFLVHVFK
jgi:hypothetical protein